MGNVLALLMPFVLPKETVDLGRFFDPSWVPNPVGVLLLFFFAACVLATLILWINMWVYWARAGRPLVWMFLLLVGAWGPAIAFQFMVYRRDVADFKRYDAEERNNLTHF